MELAANNASDCLGGSFLLVFVFIFIFLSLPYCFSNIFLWEYSMFFIIVDILECKVPKKSLILSLREMKTLKKITLFCWSENGNTRNCIGRGKICLCCPIYQHLFQTMLMIAWGTKSRSERRKESLRYDNYFLCEYVDGHLSQVFALDFHFVWQLRRKDWH